MKEPIFVQSLSRALDLVELVYLADDAVPLARLAAAADLKAPTAHNLLRTLVVRGWLEKTAGGAYLPGPQLPVLLSHLATTSIQRAAVTSIVELARQHPEAILTVAVPRGVDVCEVSRVSPGMHAAISRDWLPLDAYASATGLLHQAYATGDLLAAIRHAYPPEVAAGGWPPGTLDGFLASVRKERLSEPRFTSSPLRVAAAPVLGADGRLVAALGACVRRDQADRWPDLVRAIVTRARSITT